MVDVLDDSVPDDEKVPGGKLEGWVEDVITGVGVAPWLLLALGGGAVSALVSATWRMVRSEPRLAGPLAPLAVVGGVAYAVMAIGLTIGGTALQRYREWARRLLLGLAGVYRIAWLALFVWCLVIAARLVLLSYGHRWPWTVTSITEGLATAAVGALALSVYMVSIRRALRSPAVVAACAGGAAFAEALRARDAWAAGPVTSPPHRHALVPKKPDGEWEAEPSPPCRLALRQGGRSCLASCRHRTRVGGGGRGGRDPVAVPARAWPGEVV
jgi:hypothetical protein